MLKKILFYIKLGLKLMKKDVIDKENYRDEYNKVSNTYIKWIEEMGKFTDMIIKLEEMEREEELKILDFACGTGYISKNLLKKNIDCQITAVDYSDKMLDQLRILKDNRINIVNCDGVEFLKNTEEKYDMIFFGWALSYFNYKELFKLFKRVLNDEGIICIITNVQGTLSGIEDIFLKVMQDNQDKVIRPMGIRLNLPYGKEGLIKWFNRYGFEGVEVEEEEVLLSFHEPGQLLDWLNKTGAAAGTACIFNDYDLIKDKLIKEIKEKKYRDGKYEVNHKFAYGIFKLR
ncbi:class I SAM-dependent methyltransferase [Tissierella sp.]|uniref:class I SAM-dependent methyltransferase n=1 Tax=Tissierella sp. TaxID=41274 RepID=UPI0028618EBE|nr:class I SAM-dependent methyltransferase [Tissierella sp.]MDR7855971.1 class I SAM-dependent methyltransferase [Tissierella sp.]